MDNKALIANYENVLMNKTVGMQPSKAKSINKEFDNNKTNAQSYVGPAKCYLKENPIVAVPVVVRYAIENILHYTPQEAAKFLTFDILDKLKLKDAIEHFLVDECNYIPSRKIADESTQIKALLALCYPKVIKFDRKKFILDVYEKSLGVQGSSLPKNFFQNKMFGEMAAYTCMLYVISRFLIRKYKTIEGCYEAFACPAKANRILKDYKLTKAADVYFSKSGLDYFHYSLTEAQRDEFLYRMHKFNNIYNYQYKTIKGKNKRGEKK